MSHCLQDTLLSIVYHPRHVRRPFIDRKCGPAAAGNPSAPAQLPWAAGLAWSLMIINIVIIIIIIVIIVIMVIIEIIIIIIIIMITADIQRVIRRASACSATAFLVSATSWRVHRCSGHPRNSANCSATPRSCVTLKALRLNSCQSLLAEP